MHHRFIHIEPKAVSIGKGVIFSMVITVVSTMAGCVYVKKDLITTNCNLPPTVSFATDVTPILQSNCYSCHSTASNITGVLLENFNEVSLYVQNGRLLGTITHASGYIPMPDGAAKLDDCSIAAIKNWIDNGAPNN